MGCREQGLCWDVVFYRENCVGNGGFNYESDVMCRVVAGG